MILNRELEVVELGSQDPVAGPVRDGEGPARVLPAPAAEGDPGRAGRRATPSRPRSTSCANGSPSSSYRRTCRKAVDRELARLEKLPSAAAEYGVIRTYLDWIATLPWNKTTQDNLDLERAREILDEDHFDLEKVKERIIEHLAVSKLRNDASGQILCFVGPPGVGKTSLGQSIARDARAQVHAHLRRRRARRGRDPRAPAHVHRRDARARSSARSATPSRCNPVMLIDEIDKMGADLRGDPASAMLEVLDPEQNKTFRDHYLDLPLRPLEGAVHLHREPAGDDPEPLARPDGCDLALRLHGRREVRDRTQVPGPEAGRGAWAPARRRSRSPTTR